MGEVKVGKDCAEKGQGLGCREDEDRGVREGGEPSQTLRNFVLRAWTRPGPLQMPAEPRGRQDVAGISLWRPGKELLLPSAGAQVQSTGLQRDPLGSFFCF